MKCPHCQADNREGRKFCSKCGNPLQIICPSCQAVNEPGENYCGECGNPLAELTKTTKKPSTVQPTSFADGRYQVKKFLGEGGKKKVYLAHDTLLDRDVAFALIKTENLDYKGKKRVTREERAMGRLGDHPHIGTVFDIGEENGQPYIVQPYIAGGDIEELIEKAPEHKLPIEQVISIAREVCKGLAFAHSKGIIHRDIKPGNVMLTEDGTAKIVDFGLAVAIDLSRLTQSGMMVGTYSYMPPEQALGGKVSEKADLYSLGAMLYEMVTGRPPFVGDDSVSIIGQHISNTPPVSPTWHRADLPPALETLILQLLEKDPEKRPDSAKVVLEALESIEAGKIDKESTVEASTTTENPLYRRVFVGREQEQKQLQDAFNGAISGQGSLMMVVGEPGIGKTALTEQLSTWVKLRGGHTLVGHCYEEGSLSLPYLAFVEAMRSYVLSREAKDLREELGTGAADVARIVSEVREKLKVKPRPKGDPEEERYRLMQSVCDFLRNAANVQPLLLVLEDLHDADKGTLDMLIHVSRHVGNSRFLIVGTYRDVEVDRTHPLSAALAELHRLATYGRVLLRGLNADEVRRMLEGITREEVPWSLAEAVHRQTEGNPLFVQEVVRFLVEEGLLTQQGGRWRAAKDTPLEMSIPEGLRDVIGKRLSLLSPECNQLLSAASVIGREFDLEILRAVTDIVEDAFDNALNEAVQLSVLEERLQVGQIRYRFTHAFFRQTLYEELIAPRRLRLHQQVALALEEHYKNRLGEHAAELAEHFSQSTDPANLKKAVEYGEMAAERASDVYAYGEAVRLLDQTINVQKVLNPDDKEKICDLLLQLCEALDFVPNLKRIYEIEAPAAFSLAESLGDTPRALRACTAAFSAIGQDQGLTSYLGPVMAPWLERITHYAKSDTPESAIADCLRGFVEVGRGNNQFGIGLVRQALDTANRLGDENALRTSTAVFIQFCGAAPQHTEERMQLVEKIWARQDNWRRIIFGAWYAFGSVFITSGQRKRAEEVFEDLRIQAERTGIVQYLVQSLAMDADMAVMDGRLDDALKMIDTAKNHAEESGATGLTTHTDHSEVRTHIYRGEELDVIEANIPRGVPMYLPELSVIRAYLGMKEEVTEMLEKCVLNRPTFGTPEDEERFWHDTLYLEAAVLTGNKKVAESLMNRLDVPGLYTTGVSFPTCVIRHLGGAAALLGKYDEARKHYQEAIKICTEMPFRPELALSKLQLAELLLEHYPDEKKEALEHLDYAIKEFREMKMQPSLERALRHKDILKA